MVQTRGEFRSIPGSQIAHELCERAGAESGANTEIWTSISVAKQSKVGGRVLQCQNKHSKTDVYPMQKTGAPNVLFCIVSRILLCEETSQNIGTH